jgi:hypothetical protein
MIDKQTRNIIIDNLFKELSDCDWHVIRYKNVYNDYNARKHSQIIRLIITDLVNKGYFRNTGNAMTCLKIDTLGLDVLDAGGWIEYLKQTEPIEIQYKHETHNHFHDIDVVNQIENANDVSTKVEKNISTNSIGGDNLGTQSSESDFTKNITKNEIEKPTTRETKIWTTSNILFTVIMGLIVSFIFWWIIT